MASALREPSFFSGISGFPCCFEHICHRKTFFFCEVLSFFSHVLGWIFFRLCHTQPIFSLFSFVSHIGKLPMCHVTLPIGKWQCSFSNFGLGWLKP